jgi:hypothetical protein
LKIVQIFNDSSEVNQYCTYGSSLRPATQVLPTIIHANFIPFATAFKSTKNQQHFLGKHLKAPKHQRPLPFCCIWYCWLVRHVVAIFAANIF